MVNEPQENYKTGFISIFRSIKRHWIWDDPIKFKWWIDILLTVNYTDRTVNIGYELFECKRGQSIQSLQSWAKVWNVSKDTVRNFFKLLEKDKMIVLENLQKTTRLTVCNYDTYQTVIHDEQTTSKREANAKQTRPHPNNKGNKDNNENKEIINYPFVKFEFTKIFNGWLQYKKDRREGYKNEKSIELCYNKLVKYSKGNPELAQEIIEDAMSNNYAGFFEKNIIKKQPKPGSFEHLRNLKNDYTDVGFSKT